MLEAVYQKYHYDFRGYAAASIKRRLQAAMDRFGCHTLSQLQGRILHDAAAFPLLLDALTVPVSEMFRDPGIFPRPARTGRAGTRTYPSLKVWVAGCSTGEEAYSIAILLHEADLLGRTLIYATDINPHWLEAAQAGVYDLDRIAQFTENHRRSGANRSLSEYYTAAYGRAAFDRSFKQRIVFSDHSLASDSVFAEVELISCRNVLIYFKHELQSRAVGLFREALCRKGFLGIGAKESLQFSAHGSAFTESRASIASSKRGMAPDALRGAGAHIDGIVIGGSAGAIEALDSLLPALPPRFAAAIFIVLHLPRDRPSMLAEIFAAKCALPIEEAEDKAPVRPGTVYFAPPDYHLLIEQGPIPGAIGR